VRYEARVGDRVVRIESTLEGRLLVDGRVLAYDARRVADGQWSVVVNGSAHEVAFLGGDRVRIDGRETTATVVDERAAAARRDRGAVVAGRHEIRAPMPGLLKAVHVAEGDIVERDSALATLEAMKMENELRAPARARVQRVGASAGTKVESGALIAVLVDVGG
jgi:3-methylcrotonyl-CoA carboxylase alpha subunit